MQQILVLSSYWLTHALLLSGQANAHLEVTHIRLHINASWYLQGSDATDEMRRPLELQLQQSVTSLCPLSILPACACI